MRRASHLQLGRFLAESCLKNSPRRYIFAFKFGCIQPDINPATYIKGSRRAERLRGHNFLNAENYMRKSSDRLEQRGLAGFFSFYRMGKLVHYVSDGFTHSHNENFGGSLHEHSRYEVGLNLFFLRYISSASFPTGSGPRAASPFGIILRQHDEYMASPFGFMTDARFAIETALEVVSAFTSGVPAATFA